MPLPFGLTFPCVREGVPTERLIGSIDSSFNLGKVTLGAEIRALKYNPPAAMPYRVDGLGNLWNAVQPLAYPNGDLGVRYSSVFASLNQNLHPHLVRIK